MVSHRNSAFIENGGNWKKPESCYKKLVELREIYLRKLKSKADRKQRINDAIGELEKRYPHCTVSEYANDVRVTSPNGAECNFDVGVDSIELSVHASPPIIPNDLKQAVADLILEKGETE